MKCDICQDNKFISLPIRRDLSVEDMIGDYSIPVKAEDTSRTFPCPQCTKMVPFERVRAMRAVTRVDFETFGKLQNPVERSLAQQFGAYLHKEGLIRFDNDSLNNKGTSVKIRATLNVVLPENAESAEALAVAIDGELIPKKIVRQMKTRAERGDGLVSGYTVPDAPDARGTPWIPRAFVPETEVDDILVTTATKSKREILKEAAASRAGVTSRFSGIDFGDEFGDDL